MELNNTYDYIGQDCAGEIWGLANWDDCALCTGGNTNYEYNYYLDCAGVCFGDSEIDSFGNCCTICNKWGFVYYKTIDLMIILATTSFVHLPPDQLEYIKSKLLH